MLFSYVSLDKKKEAIEKYVIKEKISFTVVINGPEATAGSSLHLYKMSGMTVPAIVPSISVSKREQPTTSPK